MPIPEQTITEVRERADIVEVVSRFVELRRSGTNYKGLCPFHEEKTPSFVVSPDKQIFHCFGCGRGGNVFTFLMESEGVSFPDAVRSLGQHYGVEVPDRHVPDEVRTRNDLFYRANEFAASYYHQRLLDPRTGAKAQDYLRAREIPEELWRSFRLGYTGEGWDGLFRAAHMRKVPLDVLVELKLIVPRQKGTGYYDYFRSRVMFPISSLAGRTVAFGARGMEKDVEPKYLNSAESPVYVKRRTLFGVDKARDAIRKQGSVILVEGYTDCIALHGLGLHHTVASCGTAITPDHARLLRRLTHKVTIIPDGDRAGVDAALVAGAVFLAAGVEVNVAALPPGSDPDAAARSLGADRFAEITGGAMAYFEYLDYNIRDAATSPRDKEALMRRVTGGLRGIEDPLRYEVILKELARILEVDPDSLRRRELRRGAAVTGSGGPPDSGETARRTGLEKKLLRLLLENTREAHDAREKIDSDDFSQERCRTLYKLLDYAWENHIDIRSTTFHRKAEEVGLEGLAAEIALISFPPGDLATLLNDTVKRIKTIKIREELSDLREKLRDLPEESDEAVAVAAHYARLIQALAEL